MEIAIIPNDISKQQEMQLTYMEFCSWSQKCPNKAAKWEGSAPRNTLQGMSFRGAHIE